MACIREKISIDKKGKIQKSYFFDFHTPNGARIRKYGFKTKAAAEKALNEVYFTEQKGINTQQNRTLNFSAACDNYIKFDVEIYNKPKVIETKRSCIEKHLKPAFGNMKLVNIKKVHIESFIKYLKDDLSLSNATVNKYLIILGCIFKRQVDCGNLMVNPVDKVKKLPTIKPTIRALTKEELKHLLNTCKKCFPDFYATVLTAATTGIRQGELLALKWGNVNWKSNKILIDKSLYKGHLQAPKTKASIRNVNMNAELAAALKEWRLRSPYSSEDDFIFPDSVGNPQDSNNMIKRKYKPLLEKAKIGDFSWHGLRHTFATLLIAEKVPIKYIQEQLGHASIKMTMDQYGHLLPEVHEMGINVFDSLFASGECQNRKSRNVS